MSNMGNLQIEISEESRKARFVRKTISSLKKSIEAEATLQNKMPAVDGAIQQLNAVTDGPIGPIPILVDPRPELVNCTLGMILPEKIRKELEERREKEYSSDDLRFAKQKPNV
ncbi:uncharacterized protein LOC129762816 isoform X2 [Toxorhynchites rutilus septentrionalis]|uniref:uncharacterized protein LOC129762816 isoform X2 n=1 Tax=Toxorhynchites rutilus septentrionalis TaxID=329112 RepID=UPI00247AC02F|nr:uncharacterized protein LOC129762816 isoform X2 [Toxorhynchites rutilus septentrionalis]